MGILNLHFGYFARQGHNSVIDDLDEGKNLERRQKIEDFYRYFMSNERYFRAKMPYDGRKKPRKFKILHDNCRINNDSAKDFALELPFRYSIIIYSASIDFLNEENKNRDSSKIILNGIHQQSDASRLQIFEIASEEFPLTTNILHQKGMKVDEYLLQNAYRSQDKIRNVCKWL